MKIKYLQIMALFLFTIFNMIIGMEEQLPELPQLVQEKIAEYLFESETFSPVIKWLKEKYPQTLVKVYTPLEGHTDAVNAVAATDDRVVTGSWDSTARIWNIHTGALLHTLAGHIGGIKAIAITDDKVVTGSDDLTSRIWNMHTGELLHTLAGHTNAVDAVAATDDRVVTGSWDGKVRIWDIHTGALLHTRDHNDCIFALVIKDDKVITGSEDNTAKIWDINTGELLHTLAGHTNAVNAVAATDNRVVTGSRDSTARIWNIHTGALLRTLAGHIGGINAIAITDDKVVTGSDDLTSRIWNMHTGELLHTLGTAKILDAYQLKLVEIFGKHPGPIRTLAVKDDVVVTGANSGRVSIWNMHTGALLHTERHAYGINALAITDDKVVTGSKDGKTIVWKLPAAHLFEEFKKLNTSQIELLRFAYLALQKGTKLRLPNNPRILKKFNTMPDLIKQPVGEHVEVPRVDFGEHC